MTTAVVFWEGPEGLPADLDHDLFDDKVASLEKDQFALHNGVDGIPDSFPGETYTETFDENFKDIKAFGFNINPGK